MKIDFLRLPGFKKKLSFIDHLRPDSRITSLIHAILISASIAHSQTSLAQQSFPAQVMPPVTLCSDGAKFAGCTGYHGYWWGGNGVSADEACAASAAYANSTSDSNYSGFSGNVYTSLSIDPVGCNFSGTNISNGQFVPNVGGDNLYPQWAGQLYCPTNATLSGSTCTCASGYTVSAKGQSIACVPSNQNAPILLSDSKVCPAVQTGKPIDILTGVEKFTVFTGFAVGGYPLTLTWSNGSVFSASALGISLSSFGNTPAFGPLWESSLHKNIAFGPGGFSARLMRGNGSVVNFSWNAQTQSYVAEGINNDNLIVSGGLYTYTNVVSQTLETYNANGQLVSVADSTGNTLLYTYSTFSDATAPAAGYLTSIVDGNGRGLKFVYTLPSGGNPTNDGRVSSIVNSAGQNIAIAYGQSGNLTALIYPDGNTRQFLYENTSLPWALTGEIDEHGNRIFTLSYDSLGHAVSSSKAGGVDSFSISYGTPPSVLGVVDLSQGYSAYRVGVTAPTGVSVTMPNGQVSQISSNPIKGSNLPASQTQPAASGCGAANSSSTFDANGNVLSVVDFDGSQKCFAYDASNRQIMRVEGLSSSAVCSSVLPGGSTIPAGARKITTTWHPNWNSPVTISAPGVASTTVYQGQPDPFNSNVPANCSNAALMPNGLPLPLVCKQVVQATLASGAIDNSISAVVTKFSYDASGRLISVTDSRGNFTAYSYYSNTMFDGNSIATSKNTTALLVHADGVNGSTSVVDTSNHPKSAVLTGFAAISTAQSKFGGGSLLLGSYLDSLQFSASADFIFGANNFTAEAWIYPTKLVAMGHVLGQWLTSGQNSWHMGVGPNNSVFFEFSSGGGFEATRSVQSAANAITLNAWNHLALTRWGSTFNLWANGTSVASLTDSGAIYPAVAAPLTIGAAVNRGQPFAGYIDEIRILNGQAIYIAPFAPQTTSFADAISYKPTIASQGHTVGDLKSVSNPAGQVTTFDAYDKTGRVLQSTDPKGIVMTYTYTPRGFLASETVITPGQNSRVTNYSYDAVGQLTGVGAPDGTSVSFSYDAAHRLVGAMDAQGNSVSYTLDNAGNRIGEQIKDPSGTLQRSIARSFDALNRIQQVSDGLAPGKGGS